MCPSLIYDCTPHFVHFAYKFTGKERDAESGLDYFGARYYASTMGRFSSPDPSGLMYADRSNPQSFNLYSYVGNNPLEFIDPLGFYSCDPDSSRDSTDSDGNVTTTVVAGKCHFDASDFYQSHMNQLIANRPSPPPFKPSPVALPHACATGFNVGFTAGADAAAGAAYGPVATGAVGAGVAFGGNKPVNGYATAGGGAAIWKKGIPAQQTGPAVAFGAGAGVSGGVTFGNATEASQLSGNAITFGAGVDVGLGAGGQVTLGTDAAGNTIWQVSLTGGAGLKIYGYSLTTNTVAAGTGTPCVKE